MNEFKMLSVRPASELQPIFHLGSERSGSNLLRRCLDQHSAVAAPPPPHLLKWFLPRLFRYGSLDHPDCARTLLADVSTLLELQPQPWGTEHNLEDLTQAWSQTPGEFLDLFAILYQSYAEARQKNRWFCKENLISRFAEALREHFPQAKFLYLVRDPRDVYGSFKKVPGGPKHELVFAKKWREEQERCIELLKNPTFSNSCLQINYEQLLADPYAVLEKVCLFLGEDFEVDMLRTPEAGKHNTENPFWKNLDQPILKENAHKYKQNLKTAEVHTIEATVLPIMEQLEYDPEIARSPRAFSYGRLGWAYLCHFCKRAWAERTQISTSDERDRRRRLRSYWKEIENRRPQS